MKERKGIELKEGRYREESVRRRKMYKERCEWRR